MRIPSFLPLLLCCLLAATALRAADDGATWSKSVDGLRGRLQVLPPLPSDALKCRVFLELENTGDIMGQRTIRFTPGKLALQVIDKDGKLLDVSSNAYSGMSPIWEPTLLPYGGTIRFPINLYGLAHARDLREYIIDMGAMNSWIIPRTGDYFLKGTLSISKPEGVATPRWEWSGTLVFPRVEIPKPK